MTPTAAPTKATATAKATNVVLIFTCPFVAARIVKPGARGETQRFTNRRRPDRARATGPH
jgi:hypothetical protein